MIVRMRVDRGSSVEEHLGGGGSWREVCILCFWRFIHSQVYDDDGMYV